MSTSRRPTPEIAQAVLQSAARTREQAAWQLLYAIEELYPDRFERLRTFGTDLPPYIHDGHDWVDEAWGLHKDAWNRFRRDVEDWTLANRISCEAVNEAAGRLARGATGPAEYHYVDPDFNSENLEDGIPIIFVEPHNEARDVFLKRCEKVYDDVKARFVQRGATEGPVKRELDHFRFLAVHLVTRAPLAEIADDPGRFKIATPGPLKQKTVTGGARKVADLIGLNLPRVPGPRLGSHRRSPATTVRHRR